MKYMGSKNRIAKDILPIILKDRKSGQWYVEPFVGGANMIDKVEGLRIGADFNPYVIEALKLIRDNPESLPDNISEQEYSDLRKERPLSGLTGIVGFGCSFGSRFFGGFARGATRNYMLETKRNALKQSKLLKGVLFICASFLYLDIPAGSIIYCDPPYFGTTQYKDSIDYIIFWDWVRGLVKQGHVVYISEYSAPKDFICIWSKDLRTTFSTSENIKATEKLFVHVSVIDNLD